MPFLDKEFFGIKYPFPVCARPTLLKKGDCLNCSVEQFCAAPEKLIGKEKIDDVPTTH